MRTVEAGGLPIGDEHPPRIMGVLNLSPESPYDPSVFEDPAAAASHADNLIAEGADIVDIGLESANKRFDVQAAEWELERMELAVATLEQIERDAVFSIETRYAEVADAGLSRGFDMVNDIGGFADPDIPAVCEAHDAAVVKMAGPGDIERPGALESVDAIYEALADGLTDRTIVDPAFGGWSEAKTLEVDRETFRRLREFRALEHPILVSLNRKNFLKDVVGRSTEAALPASLAATAMAVERGVHVVRTHDVRATCDAARIGRAFARGRKRNRTVEELEVTSVPEAERQLERLTGDSVAASGMVAAMYRLNGLDPETTSAVEAAATAVDLAIHAKDGTVLIGGSEAALSTFAARLHESGHAPIARAIRE